MGFITRWNKNKFNDNQFNEMINNIYNKQAYIQFYNEYLYDISVVVI